MSVVDALLGRDRRPADRAGEHLSYGVVDSVLEVELHGDPLNEIGLGMLEELEEVAELLRHGAGGARALLLSSRLDKGFCAGANLWELHEGLASVSNGGGLDAFVSHAQRLFDRPRTATRAFRGALSSALGGMTRGIGANGSGWRQAAKTWGVRAFLDRVHAVFDTFDAAPIPTIAAVHGVCFGGGFELALTCDVIVADKSARFAFPELRLGLIPGFGGIPRLTRDVGNAVARDLLLSGRSLGAKRAYEVGLVAHLVGEGQAPNVARRLASQMTRFDANATRVAKAFLKPLEKERLEREKELFCELLASPVVARALEDFVASSDAMPYLQKRRTS